MPLHTPVSLAGLLSLFRSCFWQPTFETFTALVIGQIAQTGKRTVTGMLVGARRSRSWHHARAHRFFSTARWSVDEVGLTMAVLIAERLCAVSGPLVVAIDDTLFSRRGRKVHGRFWQHDPTSDSHMPTMAWGNSWVVVGILVQLPFMERAVCLPVLFRLWRPRRKEISKNAADPMRPAKPRLAREMVELLSARLPARTLHVVADSAYATGTWRGLSENVRVTSRLKANAVIYQGAPPRTGRRGRPALWGARLPTLANIATDPATTWTKATLPRAGQDVALHVIECMWEPFGSSVTTRVILVCDLERDCGYQIALISSDLHSPPADIVERYVDRWSIEVAYEDAKQVFGVGDARNRTRRAVERTVPFQFLAMSLTIVWYSLYGHHPDVVAEHRARAPWYLTKQTPSCADMLAKLRRVIIAAQFHPGRDLIPTSQQISEVQHAWASAGL